MSELNAPQNTCDRIDSILNVKQNMCVSKRVKYDPMMGYQLGAHSALLFNLYATYISQWALPNY